MARPLPSIVTSIAPGQRQDIQKAALESWLDHGFRISSLNSLVEIEELQSTYPDIKFVPQERTAKLGTGRPVIFISDILAYLRRIGCTICGIVNSDIYLPPHDGLKDRLLQRASGGLVFGPRLEVDHLTSNEGRLDPFGFDYFFFDSELLRLWPESKFCLGMPFWDLWFPMMPLLAGVPISKIISPIAHHVPHPTSRDDSFFMFNHEFAQYMLARLGETPNNCETFGTDLDGAAYYRLVKSAQQSELKEAAQSERSEAYKALAGYLDTLTRSVISYLDRNANKIRIV